MPSPADELDFPDELPLVEEIPADLPDELPAEPAAETPEPDPDPARNEIETRARQLEMENLYLRGQLERAGQTAPAPQTREPADESGETFEAELRTIGPAKAIRNFLSREREEITKTVRSEMTQHVDQRSRANMEYQADIDAMTAAFPEINTNQEFFSLAKEIYTGLVQANGGKPIAGGQYLAANAAKTRLESQGRWKTARNPKITQLRPPSADPGVRTTQQDFSKNPFAGLNRTDAIAIQRAAFDAKVTVAEYRTELERLKKDRPGFGEGND